jgi:Holliday junction DNA helicase RuvA
MIAKLTGMVDQIEHDGAVINVQGVGYRAFCSTRTLACLPSVGTRVGLLIETHVREDHIHLFGFVDAAERDWFRLLTTVQGVGARLALSILSVIAPEALGLAILTQDKSALTQAEGVGPRLAARIVNELRDKASSVAASEHSAAAPASAGPELDRGVAADAIAALENLGVGRSEAAGAIAVAARKLGGAAAADALIKAGLEELAR